MVTTLFFLRHATAQDRSLGLPDADRTLTDKGLRQSRAVARFSQRQGLLPRHLLCSPLVRAVETATLLHRHLPDCPAPQVVDWLAPGTPADQALAELHQFIDHTPEDLEAESLWMVGHEPDLSGLISRLLGSERPILRVKKASLTCVEVFGDTPAGTPSGQLLWSLPCALME